jgi:rubredoxin
MKIKDVFDITKIPEDECGVCFVHDCAYEKLPDEVLCPKCGKPLSSNYIGHEGFVVVGESNSIDNEDEYIGKYSILCCNNCENGHDDVYALIPTLIKYNANHDIFYTGGKHFLAENTDKLNDKLKNNIVSSI